MALFTYKHDLTANGEEADVAEKYRLQKITSERRNAQATLTQRGKNCIKQGLANVVFAFVKALGINVCIIKKIMLIFPFGGVTIGKILEFFFFGQVQV